MGAIIGSPPAPQRPSGCLYLNNIQLNLVDSTPTLVLLETIPAEYTDGIENVGTHRITPGKAGFYSIVGKIRLEQVVADKKYEALIKVSGVVIHQQYIHASLADVIGVSCVIPCLYLTAANYVELWAESFAGVNTVDISSALDTFLAVQRVR